MIADRQKILETNKSIRTIKQELENLLGHGALTEQAFGTISSLLPSESSVRSGASAPSPVAANPVVTPAPPAYAQTTAPSLPSRAPPPQHSKPIVGHARGLYAYHGPQANDLSFEKDDHIEIFQYVNPDWWVGRNQRTGDEGLFPANYVLMEDPKGPQPQMVPAFGGYQPVQQGPPAPVNPYNAAVPPMAVAEGGKVEGGKSKLEEGGKKFGKKLGNAAIFGAGATIGSNLINSIF